MKREIMLQNTSAGIMAHHLTDGRPDAEIVQLFGTHVLLTAFTRAADMEAVVTEIQQLNPNCTVSVI